MFLQSLKSKTIWWNILTAILAILAMPEIIQLLPESALKWIVIINAVGNMILRVFFTTQAIEDK
jgi:CDP-diglyceride synthetase